MSIRLNGSTSGYVELDVPAVAGNQVFRLPAAAPSTAGTSLVSDTSGNLSYSTALAVSSVNGGPLAGFRNAIINGNFDFWQRGTSFSNPASAAYTADRWTQVYDGTGATRTISRQDFTLGQTDVPGEPQFYLRWAQTVAGSGATFNVLSQRIEGVRTFADQQVTFSFYAKASSSITLPGIQFAQMFGTGGSPSAQVLTAAATNISIGTTWTKVTGTVTIPSISGKTLGTTDNSYLAFDLLLPINTTFTLDVARVQVEPGTVATPFERRDYGQELALCQRYFYKTDKVLNIQSYASGPSANKYFHVTHPVTMRAAPTATSNFASGTNNQSQTVDTSATYYTVRLVAIAAGECAVSYSSGNTMSIEL